MCHRPPAEVNTIQGTHLGVPAPFQIFYSQNSCRTPDSVNLVMIYDIIV